MPATNSTDPREVAREWGYRDACARRVESAYYLDVRFRNMSGGDWDLYDELFQAYSAGVQLAADELRTATATR